ncbi:hypothetical protein [Halalkalibacter alkalisediminis]|uniref:Uncharacterized protein n=1 Tax=Halalkalibacter alkalisediminis TaxID=935616 RepID=A0ABV6NLF3_9BACI|nr:hypothetical protein [Halalkalibacter alkalisediminis]
MMAFFISVPIIAYFSMIAFKRMNLSVKNYEGKDVPYSLGVLIFYSYSFLYAYPPHINPAFSVASFAFLLSIWLFGLLDDVYGKPYPKGLKGHMMYFFKNHILTTGLLKAGGTIVAAILFLWVSELRSYFAYVVAFLLITGLPHVMNLFDTRPLRVWKLTVSLTILIMIFNPLPSFLFVLMLLMVFYIWYVLEGSRKAMLGDNGATVVGAILAVVVVNHVSFSVQYSFLVFVLAMILVAEKYSFSAFIEKSRFLRTIDQIGIIKKG